MVTRRRKGLVHTDTCLTSALYKTCNSKGDVIIVCGYIQPTKGVAEQIITMLSIQARASQIILGLFLLCFKQRQKALHYGLAKPSLQKKRKGCLLHKTKI